MDKVKELDSGFSHGLTIAERKNIVINGVKKIESFDNEEFLMETTLGYLAIKGAELEIIKLDTYQGNVSIKGRIDSLMYLDNNGKKEKESSLINKLFKWYWKYRYFRFYTPLYLEWFFLSFSKLIINYCIVGN